MKKLVRFVTVLGLILCFGANLHGGNFPNPGSAPVNVTSEPCCFHFVGYSSGTTVGSKLDGIFGMNTLCQASFGSSARMCTTEEYLTSPQLPSPTPPVNGWVAPHIVGFFFDTSNSIQICLDYSLFTGATATLFPLCSYKMSSQIERFSPPSGALFTPMQILAVAHFGSTDPESAETSRRLGGSSGSSGRHDE